MLVFIVYVWVLILICSVYNCESNKGTFVRVGSSTFRFSSFIVHTSDFVYGFPRVVTIVQFELTCGAFAGEPSLSLFRWFYRLRSDGDWFTFEKKGKIAFLFLVIHSCPHPRTQRSGKHIYLCFTFYDSRIPSFEGPNVSY
ncbi:hypothetical protein Hanom_Chr06g00549001 [Helianthus anomalus]